LLHAHARHAAATGDIGIGTPRAARAASPLQAVRAATAVHATLAESPRAALRNLAYLQNDLADPVLRRHLLRLKRAARTRYEQLLTDAVAVGELRANADVRTLARMIEVTLDGSFLAWTLYREGSAAARLRDDVEATLRPYLARRVKRKG
jgi:hypothetical protein